MNQDEWYKNLVTWLQENAVPQGTPESNEGWVCKDCNVTLQGRGKVASLHFKRMMLAGSGETVTLIEPFCPVCGKCYSVPPFLDHGGLRDIF